MEAIVSEIKQFIAKKARVAPEELSNGTEIAGGRTIPSLAVLELVIHLEKLYQVEIGGDEIVEDNFKDVAALAAFVQRKRKTAVVS